MGRFVVGRARELPPGLSRSVRVGGRRIGLFNDAGNLYAVDEPCPHMGADLSNGELRDGTLTCAWHGWCFDIRTGRGITRKWAQLKVHRLFREGDDLVLEVQEAGAPHPDPEAAPLDSPGDPER